MRLGEMLFDLTSKCMFCAYMVVVHIGALIAEELGYAFTRSTSRTVLTAEDLKYAFTRDRNTGSHFASQAAMASSARVKAAARAAGA